MMLRRFSYQYSIDHQVKRSLLSIADLQKVILQIYLSKSYKNIRGGSAIKFKQQFRVKVWCESI